MATIENRLIHLGNIPGTDVPYYHRYTVYTKDSGEQWVLRSGPSNDYRPSVSGVSGDFIGSVSEDAGTIKFEFEKYKNADGTTPYSVIMGAVDYPPDLASNNTSYDTRLHLTTGPLITGSDSELDTVVSQMVSRGNEINSLELPYSAIHQNSNTSDNYIWGELGINYDDLEYTPIEGTGYKQEIILLDGTKVVIGQESETLKNQIVQSGGTISGDDIFAPATNEDFESTVNTATVAWDLVESSADWLWQHTGKPLSQIIEEAGSTAADWTSEVAKAIGTTTSDLFNSAKGFFSDLFGLNSDNVTAYRGDQSLVLADSGMIATDAVYVDSDGNPVSVYDSLFRVEDSNGGVFTVVKDSIYTTLKDGTTVAVSSLVEMTETATRVTENFVNGYMGEAKALFTTGDGIASLINDVSAGLEKGLEPEQIAKIIATKLVVKTAMSQIKNEFILNESDQALLDQGKAITDLSPEGQQALNNFAVNHPAYNTAYLAAVSFATTILLHANDGMNGEEYTAAAIEATAQAAVQTAISTAISKGWLNMSSSAGAGVGAAAGYVISASIRDMFADDHMNSHQWQSTFASAGVIGVAAYAGAAAGSAIATAMSLGAFAGPIGIVGAVIATIIVSQFMGGKEYGAGEYADPSYIIQELYQITSKADGSGLEIFGVGKEGVTLIASQNGVDDIYGSRQSDVLVGNDQKNIIVGSSGNDNGTDNDMIEGKGGDDILLGKEGHDHINGGDGNDQIDGGTGNDRLIGGNGNDIIIGDQGDDTIDGGNGDDQIDAGDGDDIIYTGSGNDIIISGTGDDQIEAGEGDDVIFSESGNDLIKAGAGNDQIDSGDGNDEVYGGDGNDSINTGLGDDITFAGSGVDIINAGLGNDIVDAGKNDDLVLGGTGNDIIYGNDGNDELYGELGNDYLMGGAGDDKIAGSEGDDILDGNKGDDSLDGGTGNDLYIHTLGDGNTQISDEAGLDTLRIFGIADDRNLSFVQNGNDLEISLAGAANDKITIKDQFSSDATKVETLKIDNGIAINLSSLNFSSGSAAYTKSTYDDRIDSADLTEKYQNILKDSDQEVIYNGSSSWYQDNYDVNVVNEVIDYTKYNEVEIRSYKAKRNIFGGHYNVYYKYYETNLGGTFGNDKIVGSWWSENIWGGDGDDYLYGNDGNDNIFGGNDNDLIYLGDGNDNGYGENGTDKIYGGEGNDNVEGNNGNDTLYGEAGNDVIMGRAGDDLMLGGKGNDFIKGGDGNDIAFGGDNSDNIDGNAGNDYLLGENGDDIISGGSGDDTIIGGSGNDILNGNEGNDLIKGGSGLDIIDGGDGNDQINAGSGNDMVFDSKGNDQITLGDGKDIFIVQTTNGGTKIINDFDRNEDRVVLKDVTVGFSSLIANHNLTQDGSDVRFSYGSYNLVLKDTLISELNPNNFITSIVGNELDNILNGDEYANAIFGLDGNDILNGNGGDDLLWGGNGADQLNGNAGDDILYYNVDSYWQGSRTIVGKWDLIERNPSTINADNGDSANLSDHSASQDLFNGGDGEDVLIMSEQSDTILLDLAVEKVNDWNGSHYEQTAQNGFNGLPISIETIYAFGGDDIINLSSNVNTYGDVRIYGDSGNDTIWTNQGNDTVYGGDGNDNLQTGKGDDLVYGESDNDFIDAGEGNDKAYGGAGNDTIHGNNGNDLLNGEDGNDFVYGESGDDIINGGFGSDYLDGGIGNDTLNGNEGDDKLYGYDGNDYLDGGDGNNIIDGGSGDDMIKGGWGTDYIDGGTGFDRVDYSGSTSAVSINMSINSFWGGMSTNDRLINVEGLVGTIYSDALIGTDGGNELAGLDGDDYLDGMGGNDSIGGGNGNDVIKGGWGDDTMDGGVGFDIVDYSSSTSGVSIDLTLNTTWGGMSTGDKLANIEGLTGTNYRDGLTGTSGDNRLIALAGDDYLNGMAGNDYLDAGDGNDDVLGGDGEDLITGGKGNDTLSGNQGSDTYFFNIGDGNDIVRDNDTSSSSSTSVDKIKFGDGIKKEDIIFSKVPSTNDLLILVRNNSQDSIKITGYFDAGVANTIEKLEFANQETLDISNKNNLSNLFDAYINDNDSANNINGSSSKDYILGNKGGDHIEGGQGFDEIHGGDGDDVIYGNKTLSFNYLQSGLYGYTPDENNSTQLVGDFNGDGKDDIVNLQSDGWSNNWVALSNGSGGFALMRSGLGIESGYWANKNNSEQLIGDFNGDGKDDIINVQSNGAAWLALSNGNGTFKNIATGFYGFTPDENNSTQLIGDFNGDGKDDIVNLQSDGWSNNWIALSTGGNAGFSLMRYGLGIESGYWANRNNSEQLIGDFNGDGKDDIVNLQSDGKVWLALSKGNGTFNNISTGLYGYWPDENNSEQLVGDFNGDGKDDIVNLQSDGTSNNWVALSTGNGGFSLLRYGLGIERGFWGNENNSEQLVGDFNGDGFDDIANVQSDGNNWLALSKGDGTFIMQSNATPDKINGLTTGFYGNQNLSTQLIGDFDGNGSSDILNTHNDGSHWISYSQVSNSNQGDALYGDTGNDKIYGASGDDTIYGGDGDDYLDGSSGNDTIKAGWGTDYIDGGVGSDTVDYQDSTSGVDIRLNGQSLSGRSDLANKGWGGMATYDTILNIENVTATNYNDGITGSNVSNRIITLDGNDYLDGLAGNDYLDGGKGNDSIYGGNDNDVLIGGLGKDILRGGSGADIFDFSSLQDSSVNSLDYIEDFEHGVDKIDLSKIAENISFDSLEFLVQNGHTIIKDHNSDFAIDLQGQINLSQSDFMFHN